MKLKRRYAVRMAKTAVARQPHSSYEVIDREVVFITLIDIDSMLDI